MQRKYVGAFVYNKDMVTEEYLDHLMELSARWNDLYKSIPNAQMHIFDKASHFIWLDQPEDFNHLATWFLGKE